MARMRSRLPALFVGVILLSGSCGWLRAADNVRLQKIRVIGSQRFQESDLVAALGLKPGMMVSVDTLQQAGDRLMETGALASLQYKYVPVGTGIAVEYVVTDGSDFLPCRYDNIVWATPDELTKAVHEKVPLYDGTAPTSGDLLDQVSLAISQVLVKYGVVTKVRYELHTRGIGGPIDAISFVSDTIRPKVQEVTLAGADLLTAQEKTDNTKRLIGDDYNATDVRDSIANGVSFLYGAKGYLRVKVREPQAKIVGDPLQAMVSVTVPVSQGEQYRWASLSWTGNNAIATADLAKLVTFRAGDVVDRARLDMQLEQVRRAYKNKGYLAAKLDAAPAFNDQDHTVMYQLTVNEGALYRMGALHITGLDASVIQQLESKWELKPGDPYDADYLMAFLRENASLINAGGAPKTVKTLVAPTPEKTVNVTVEF